MADYERTLIYNNDGNVTWCGSHGERLESLKSLDSSAALASLGLVLGSRDRIDGSATKSSKTLTKFAEEKGYISSKGNLKGFITILPKARVIHRIVDAINELHYNELRAVEVAFPSIFDNSDSRFRELTKSYEINNRMYSVGSAAEEIRLSYAADPGLFALLADTVMDEQQLPLAIASESDIFRRFKSGELGRFDSLRQFNLPDLHILCTEETAYEMFLKNITLSAQIMHKLFPRMWTFSCDLMEDFAAQFPSFFSDVSRAVNSVSVFNILKRRPRYYRLKTGFMMDAGDRAIMNYNMQWDEENPERFNIRSHSGSKIVVLHGTLLHAWSRILPVFINRHLTYGNAQVLPTSLSPLQVALIPTSHEALPLCEKRIEELSNLGIRSAVHQSERTISHRIADAKRNDIPYFAVIGPKEVAGAELVYKSTYTNLEVDLASLTKDAELFNFRAIPLRTQNQRVTSPFKF